jgi:hypothetical protein
MAIPEFTEIGLLPAGVHTCTLDELQERFDGGFASHRYKLFLRLRAYLQRVKGTGLVAWVAVDGSFVTTKEQPGDIDLVVVLHPSHDYAAVLSEEQSQVLSKKWVARHFEFDMFTAPEGSDELREWLEFFTQVKGRPGSTKGILKVVP